MYTRTLLTALFLMPLIVNGAEITIDGEVRDWNGIPAAASDPAEGAHPCDWRKLYLAHDDSFLYLRYTTEEPVDFTKGAAYMVLLDTDGSVQTGFQGGLSIGADYLLQGETLFKYSGSGTDWAWEDQGKVGAAVKANEAEFAIDLAKLDAPTEVALVLYGDNEAAGVEGQTLDVLPDTAYQPNGSVQYPIK